MAQEVTQDNAAGGEDSAAVSESLSSRSIETLRMVGESGKMVDGGSGCSTPRR